MAEICREKCAEITCLWLRLSNKQAHRDTTTRNVMTRAQNKKMGNSNF